MVSALVLENVQTTEKDEASATVRYIPRDLMRWSRMCARTRLIEAETLYSRGTASSFM